MRIFLLLAASLVPAFAEDAAYTQASEALDQGLPQVAIYKLKQNAGKWKAPADRDAADLLQARALFAAGRYQEITDLLQRFDAKNEEAQFWLAEAWAALDQYDKALPIYRSLPRSGPHGEQAEIGEARMLNAMGRGREAANELQDDLKSHPGSNEVALELAEIQFDLGRPAETQQALALLKNPAGDQERTANYLAAAAQLASGDVAAARDALEAIHDPPAELAAPVGIALAQCLIKQGDIAQAEKALEKFIDENSRLPQIESVFVLLDRVYAAQTGASNTELRRWATDESDPSRAQLAQFYLARNEERSGRTDKSIQLYQDFLGNFPAHPLVNQAREDLATLLLEQNKPSDALVVLQPGSGDRVAFLKGSALAALGKYQEAEEAFLQSASGNSSETALFNAAVCGLLAGASDAQNAALGRLAKMPDGAPVLDHLRFIEASYLAALRRPEAVGMLREIAAGNSAYATKAMLALAEYANLTHDPKSAALELRRISDSKAPTDEETKQRADCLAVFLADNGSVEADDQASRLAKEFLDKYPHSQFEPEIRMKLGELMFRRGDYQGARDQFDKVGEEFPDSPLNEKALFLSAQAQARSMDPDAMQEALAAYERVARAGGPLALRARLAEALLFNALRQPQNAIGVLDQIIDSKSDPEMRSMAIIEKGDTYFSLGASDPANFRKAIDVWKPLATDASAPVEWSHQAMAKMGEAYEKLGENDAALNCYYNVFSEGQKGGPEYFWFYKAGFEAGSLLERQKLLKEAIAVYEKLAAVDGPRAQEVRDRINKLRLENFIWEN